MRRSQLENSPEQQVNALTVSTGMEEALANVVRLEATVLRAAAAVIQV